MTHWTERIDWQEFTDPGFVFAFREEVAEFRARRAREEHSMSERRNPPRGDEVEQPEDVWAEIERGAEAHRDGKTLTHGIERFTTTTAEGRELVSRWRRSSGIDDRDRTTEGERSYAYDLAEALARDLMLEAPALSFSDALDRVLRAKPELAAVYSREMRGV